MSFGLNEHLMAGKDLKHGGMMVIFRKIWPGRSGTNLNGHQFSHGQIDTYTAFAGKAFIPCFLPPPFARLPARAGLLMVHTAFRPQGELNLSNISESTVMNEI